MERQPGNRVRYVFLGILFLFALLFQAHLSWHHLDRLLKGRKHVREPFVFAPFQTTIASVSAEARQAGLRPGDKVLAINGNAAEGRSSVEQALAHSHPGNSIQVEFRHGGEGQIATTEVNLRALFARAPGFGDWLLVLILNLGTPAFCLLLGFFVVFRRPRDRLAWILLGLTLSFAQLTGGEAGLQSLVNWQRWLHIPSVAYTRFFAGAWPFWMLMFGVYFPETLPFERRYPWVKWVLGIPMLLLAAGDALVTVGLRAESAGFARPHHFLHSLGPLSFIFALSAVATFFGNLAWKLGRSSNPDAKRRLRLLLWGAGVSLTPLFLLLLAGRVSGRTLTSFPQWLWLSSVLLLALFPVTLAYVIIVQRALDVRVVVRQGVQYALAQGGVRVLQIVFSAIAIYFAVSLANEPGENRTERVISIGVGLTLVVFVSRLARKLRVWTDRRFFREAYDAERILIDLSETVRTIVETRPLLETVALRISESLHVPRVAVMLRNNGSYEVAHAVGFGEAPLVRFSKDSLVVEHIRSARDPLRVYFDDPNSWLNGQPEMQEERSNLQALHARLLLPLAQKDHLLGFVTLGPKQSEEPYSGGDLRLLQSVAVQTGLALENSRLAAAIARELARQERLNREIEIAREVQERLYPHNHSNIPGLEYAGKCRPAARVGGDYYDFLEIPGGLFGFAIADVSGKGIPAALLMANLHAALRSLTLNGCPDPASMTRGLNRLIFEATQSNTYATFFYGQFDRGASTLTYVNAGHNAPMLLRRSEDGWQITRLDEGGLAIGAFPNAGYQKGSVGFAAGDLLVAFTDGITEAMNPAGEEWGEEGLAEAILGCTVLTPAEMIDRLMAKADAFAAGAAQHDDMTLVVLSVKGPPTDAKG